MRLKHVLGASLTVVALTGCRGEAEERAVEPAGETPLNVVQPGAPGEPTETLSSAERSKLAAPEHTEADADFMRGMIHHHAQALHMTALVPERSAPGAGVSLLAERMELSQAGEVEQMQAWLEARGEEAPVLHPAHGHAHGTGQVRMPGMLTAGELRRLAAARGGAFDRLFLGFMIRHHEGAVTMVRQLYASGGGAEPEVDTFARHVEADQEIEIARMRDLLASLSAP